MRWPDGLDIGNGLGFLGQAKRIKRDILPDMTQCCRSRVALFVSFATVMDQEEITMTRRTAVPRKLPSPKSDRYAKTKNPARYTDCLLDIRLIQGRF